MAHKATLNPGAIDRLERGRICDPQTPGLRIEALSGGRKRWKFRRRLPGTANETVKMHLGLFPAYSMAEARAWARELNERIEAGEDPRLARREEEAREAMTVSRAHALYMEAVCEGRASRAKRPNKPRTVADKLAVYQRDIAPTLAKRVIHDVAEADLVRLVTAKGKTARIRANRLAAELKVFFGWAASLRGMEVGLDQDPSRRLHDLKFPETPRARQLAPDELEWFLKALEDFRRGMLLWLLSGARLGEIEEARQDELVDGVWAIPAARTKNGVAHRIALGPWGLSLMRSDSEWVFPAPKREGARARSSWHRARDRVKKRMEKLAGRPIERFTPHDFRRTLRSNTKRLKIDFETAEAMLNHVKKGLERTYDRYDLEEEKRLSFLKWEEEVAAIATRAGVAEALGVVGAGGEDRPGPGSFARVSQPARFSYPDFGFSIHFRARAGPLFPASPRAPGPGFATVGWLGRSATLGPEVS